MGVKREYIILGIPVTVLGAVSLAEANVLVSKEVALNDPQERKITYIEITEVSSEEVDIEVDIEVTTEGVVKKLRRITGYLSDINNFNDPKRAELADRLVHGR